MNEHESEHTQRQEPAREASPAARQRRTAVIAIVVVALAAAGSAIAASKLHGGSSPARGGLGRPGPSASTGGTADPGLAPPGTGGRFRGPGGGISAAADYLGLPPTELFNELRSGKTLAQIAGSTAGKSVSGLVAAMAAAEKSDLQQLVDSGRLTQAQADTIAAGIQSRVTAIVNGQLGQRGGFGFRDRDDDGDGDGPPGQSQTSPPDTL